MAEFADVLKIGFFEGPNMLTKREGYKYSKLSEDGSLYLNMNSEKDRLILEMLLKVNVVHIDGFVYKILGREFMIDGTALFVDIEKIQKEI